MTLEENNEIELYELQLGSGLGNVLNDSNGGEMNKGNIAQLMFERIIGSEELSCQKLLKSGSYASIVEQYNM